MAEELNLSLVKKSADLASIIVKHHPYVFLLGSHKKSFFMMLSRQTFHGGEFSNREISKELGIVYDGSQISKVYKAGVIVMYSYR